jgi:glycosyltransferase involved in cell wall biosynthesis
MFADVTLLITHYNRSNSLKRLLAAFADLNCSFADVVVSDDGSQPVHLESVKSLQSQYKFRLVTAPVNKGLANNLNKGQEAVTTPYTLYVQEDFVPKPAFTNAFQDALTFMQQDASLDMVRMYAYGAYPYLKPYKNGYSEMAFTPWATNYNKIYCYSDHPHLRRSTFNDKFGKYVEGIKGDRTEYRMCISFVQKKGKGLFYNDFQGLFTQENNADEPSTMKRRDWTRSNNPIIATARYVYRQIRYNYDIRFLL